MSSLFAAQLSKGGKGEDQVKALFEGQGYTVQDVTSDPYYQGLGIDLIVGECPFETDIEVKADDWISKTHRIFAESRTDLEHDQLKEGWLWFCRASELWYIDNANQIVHIFDPEELRQFVKNNPCKVDYCDDRPRGTDRIREGFYVYVKDLQLFKSYRTLHL